MIIQTFLWIAIFDNSQKQIVYGYTLSQMILYTILSQMIAKFLKTGVENEISADVKTGGLSKYIIKPFNYLLYNYSVLLGKRQYIWSLFWRLFLLYWLFLVGKFI